MFAAATSRFFFLLVLLLPLAALAQRPALKRPAARPPASAAPVVGQAAPAAPAVVLAGHVSQPTARVVSLRYAPDWQGQPTRTVQAPVSAAGDFQLVLPALAAPTEARLDYADDFTSLYLAPGYTLRVTFTAGQLDETSRYTGRGAAENNYLLQAFIQSNQDDAAGLTPDARAARLSAAELRQAADLYRQQRRAALAAYQASHPLPPAFVRRQQQALDYEWASALLSYAAHQTTERRQQGYATLPVGYYDFVRELQLARQDSALTGSSLQNLLLTYGFTQLNDEQGHLPAGPDAARLYQRATDDLGDGRVRDVAVGRYLLTKVESEHADIRSLLPAFRAHNRDSTIARALRQVVQTHLALLSGTPAPDFVASDRNGNRVLLSTLRGQVVYLDFWASWCKPCLAEMPAAAKLRRRYQGRNVRFLYVSLDARDADWRLAIAAYDLQDNAIHLRDGAAFDGPAARAFGVQSIPSHWLIGPDGTILANPAPPPSDSLAIRQVLNAALAR